jgi:quercetin dioxygenase-like cupin family protein/ribosome-binding protein aMBF1 (putative translation factor)
MLVKATMYIMSTNCQGSKFSQQELPVRQLVEYNQFVSKDRNNEEYDLEVAELGDIGVRIKSFRQMRGWTLDLLASRARLSKSYMSRLEDGDRQPSIASLISISRALGVSLSALLSDEAPIRDLRVVRGEEVPAVTGNGLVYQVHSGAIPGAVMQPLRITISAGRTGEELYRHEGEEWLYVLSGKLNVIISEESFELNPGDSIHFDASAGHRLTAADGKDVEAILVASVAPRALLSSYL